MTKPPPTTQVQFPQLQQRLTDALARQLAGQYPDSVYLMLCAGWDTTAALDALVEAFGPRLHTLDIRKGGRDLWPWLERNPALANALIPGKLIPEEWQAVYPAPTGRLFLSGIPTARTALDLAVFPAVKQFQLERGGHLRLPLNGTATALSLGHISAEPDASWASLKHLSIDSTKLDLALLLEATPQIESITLCWPFRLNNLESLLQQRHWKSINILGNQGMPTDFINRLWDAGVADDIHCRNFPGPFWEDVFHNGKWDGWCTR